jgi:hypothetical protein
MANPAHGAAMLFEYNVMLGGNVVLCLKTYLKIFQERQKQSVDQSK